MLCLGSSLRVSPANQIPIRMNWNGGKIVIVNLQKTPIDDFAELIIHARIQTVMAKVMEKLEMPIPGFRLDRWAEVSLVNEKLSVSGVDKMGGPFTLFKNIKANFDKSKQNQKIDLKFQGHFNENALTVYVPTATLQNEGKIRINMVCNPHGCSDNGQRVTFGHWEQTKAHLIGENKEGQDSTFDLKQEQGPYKPTP